MNCAIRHALLSTRSIFKLYIFLPFAGMILEGFFCLFCASFRTFVLLLRLFFPDLHFFLYVFSQKAPVAIFPAIWSLDHHQQHWIATTFQLYDLTQKCMGSIDCDQWVIENKWTTTTKTQNKERRHQGWVELRSREELGGGYDQINCMYV